MAMGRTYESVHLQTKVIEGKTASSLKKDNDVNKLKYNAFVSKNKAYSPNAHLLDILMHYNINIIIILHY